MELPRPESWATTYGLESEAQYVAGREHGLVSAESETMVIECWRVFRLFRGRLGNRS